MNKFVFIIPFRNVKEFIKQCYTSIIVQDNKNWIAIFCDDESTDLTLDVIKDDEFVKNNPDKFIFRKNKKG